MSKKPEIFLSVSNEIDKHSLSIATALSEMKLWSNDRVIPTISVRIKNALKDCFKLFSAAKQGERDYLVTQYNSDIPNWKKEKIKAELSIVNRQLKDSNRVLHTFLDMSEYRLLKDMLKEKHPDAFQEWCDYQQKYLNQTNHERK